MRKVISGEIDMQGKFRYGAASKRGFTLVELLIVLAIIGLLSALAIPDFARMAPHYRLRAAGSNLQADLEYAMMEAVKTSSKLCWTSVADTGYHIYLDGKQDGDCKDDRDGDASCTGPNCVVRANFDDSKSDHHYPGVKISAATETVFELWPNGTVMDGLSTPQLVSPRFTLSVNNPSSGAAEEWMYVDLYPMGAIETEGPRKTER